VITAVGGLAFAAQSTGSGWLAFGLLVTVGNLLSSYATHTYRAELFPTPLRGRAIGLIYAFDRLATAFSSYFIGFLLVTGGVSWVLACVAGFSLVNMAVVLIWGPRTHLQNEPVNSDVILAGSTAILQPSSAGQVK
jgi:putative MFS transporter